MADEKPREVNMVLRAEANGYLLGTAIGWREAADWLMRVATARFVLYEDEKAQALRLTSTDMRTVAERKRREYDEHKDEEG